jgi:tyrosyl-tRNA synthetase
VDLDGDNAAGVVNNLDWTASLLDPRLPPRHRQALPGQPDARARRRPSRLEAGISYTEFSYVLLQSMDYLELFRGTAAGCRAAAVTSGATSPPAWS